MIMARNVFWRAVSVHRDQLLRARVTFRSLRLMAFPGTSGTHCRESTRGYVCSNTVRTTPNGKTADGNADADAAVSIQNMLLLCYCLLLLFCVTLGQERPFLYAQKFDYSQNYRTNVCERQRLLWNNSLELPNALQGLNLTIAITNYQVPYENTYFTLQEGRIKEKDPGECDRYRCACWCVVALCLSLGPLPS
jgi:hypothetical protein